jgi:hypothetical protein
MKNRFVHYKIHSIELLWWFQSNYQCRSNAIENITKNTTVSRLQSGAMRK